MINRTCFSLEDNTGNQEVYVDGGGDGGSSQCSASSL